MKGEKFTTEEMKEITRSAIRWYFRNELKASTVMELSMNNHIKAESWNFKRHWQCNFTIPEEIEMVERYKSGETFSNMAEELGTNRGTLWKIATEQYGITPYQTSGYPGKFDLNIDVFSDFHNEKSMYVLGLIYTDGHISKGRERLHFVTTDKEQMENFRECLGSTHNYFTIPAKDKCKKQYRVAISYQPMIDDLKKLVPKSSLETKTIEPKVVNSNYFNHFLRGFFDGDGSVSKDGKQVVFTGNYDLMRNLSGIISDKLGIEQSSISKVKGATFPSKRDTYHLGYYKVKHFRRFYDFLYNKADFFLSRKKEIFEQGV